MKKKNSIDNALMNTELKRIAKKYGFDSYVFIAENNKP